MTGKPKIDIVMLVRDRPHYTEMALSRMLAATIYPYYALTIIDDASELWLADRLDEHLKMFPGITRVIHHTCQQGVTGCMNEFIFEISTADYIAKLDNDLLVPYKWLTNMLATMESTPNAGVVGMGDYKCPGDIGEEQALKTSHVGGIFLAKRSVFYEGESPHRIDQFKGHPIHGWTNYQWELPSRGHSVWWTKIRFEYLDDPAHRLCLRGLPEYDKYLKQMQAHKKDKGFVLPKEGAVK